MPNKKRRQGSIYQRSEDGLYVVTVSLGTIGGVRKREVRYARTETQALEELVELRRLKADGSLGSAGAKDSVAAFLETWLRDVKAKKKATTWDDYERQVRLHIVPHIGRTKLAKLGPAHVDAVLAKAPSDRVRRKVYFVLSAAIRWAIRRRVLGKNPLDAVDAPVYRPAERTPLTIPQARRLLAAIRGDRNEALYLVALYTGMREGELFALTPADVDLKAGRLSIVATLENLKGRTRSTATKTAGSRRAVVVPSDVVDALRGHLKARMASGVTGPYLFTSPEGRPLQRQNFLTREWYPLLERAKVPKIRFYDLRHTMASLMLAAGEHPKVVQEQLGHASITTTLDTYSHLTPTMGKAAVTRLQRSLRKRS